jgi:hypothetical protein
MRCLHCGKELAVFKRLARHEFCSDTHRRQYQEKYDQLALGRLLETPSKDGKPAPLKNSKGPITLGLADPPGSAQPPPAPARGAREKGEPAGIAGILLARLFPTAVQTTARVAAEIEMEPTLAPQPPRRQLDSPPAAFRPAVQVRFLPAARIQRSSGRANERWLEVRGFTRTAPLIEIHVNGSGAAKLEAPRTALDVRISPQFPSEEPGLWRAPVREFAGFPIQPGPLGEPERPGIRVEAKHNSAAAVLETEVESERESIPERATRPMPVTLHGVAAGRTRPMQVYPALPGGTAVQAPRCEALPLRRVMVLSPAVKREIKLPELQLNSSVNSGLSRAGKTTAGVVAVLAIATGSFFVRSNAGHNAPMVDAGPPLPNAPDDWLQSFSPDAPLPRKISLLRASGDLSDYRVEFESVIQSKAAGWVYRAKDPRNFYVSKLEIQKPGTEPAVAAAHYAVIDGQELAHTRVPLPRGAAETAVYKIRFQAVGNHFTTWVQDQKVDDWTDDRIKAGGAGLYSEDGERAALRSSFKVVPLMRKK